MSLTFDYLRIKCLKLQINYIKLINILNKLNLFELKKFQIERN
jgi:hypothetical protein